MPLMEEVIEEPIGLDPTELFGRLEHSRIVGDYYRDLSLNYALYEEQNKLCLLSGGEAGQPWPEHPYPNEKYTGETV